MRLGDDDQGAGRDAVLLQRAHLGDDLPARARAAYGSDGAYERALAVGELLPNGTQLALLPSTRPAADNLRSALPAPGTYLVAAAQ